MDTRLRRCTPSLPLSSKDALPLRSYISIYARNNRRVRGVISAIYKKPDIMKIENQERPPIVHDLRFSYSYLDN